MKLSKSLPFLTLLLVPVLIQPAVASASPVTAGLIESSGMGTVDREKARNKVQAKLLSKRAAVVDAQRNLLEVIEGVQVTSGTTVKDAQLESDMIANRVKGLLKGAFIVEENITEEDGDYLAEVKLAVCVNASRPQCKTQSTLSAIIRQSQPPVPAAQTFKPSAVAAAETATTDEERYTGLIIDMQGTAFVPALSFNLVTPDESVVYGPGSYQASSNGDWVSWASSTDEARGMTATVGDAPLTVTASGLTAQDNILIAPGDALGIYEANLRSGNFLRDGKVIIVNQPAQTSL